LYLFFTNPYEMSINDLNALRIASSCTCMFLKAAINVHLFILFIYLFFIHLILFSWLQAGLQECAYQAVPDSAAAEVPPGEQQGVPQHPQPEVRRAPG
jgi:hypothetical protein